MSSTDSKRAANADRWAVAWSLIGLVIVILWAFDAVASIYALVWVPTAVLVATIHGVRADLYRTRTTVTFIGD